MSMTRSKIEATITGAQQFITAAQSALERLDAERGTYDYQARVNVERPKTGGDYSYGSAESGTLRRKSMDLTRTLAELRK